MKFHVVGLKCLPCGSYNTTRIGGDEPLPSDPDNSLNELVEELNMEVEVGAETEGSEEEEWETVSEGDENSDVDDGVENESETSTNNDTNTVSEGTNNEANTTIGDSNTFNEGENSVVESELESEAGSINTTQVNAAGGSNEQEIKDEQRGENSRNDILDGESSRTMREEDT